MRTNFTKIAALASASMLALSVAACDKNDEPDVVYETNDIVVTNDADECPRADGQPCK